MPSPKAKPVGNSPKAGTKYRVFVSHATADKWIARTICEKIDAIPGAKSFRDDRDIEGGDSIPKRLKEEIENADEVLVLLTPVSIKRQWVIMEVGMAFQARKRLVPICYHIPIKAIPTIENDRAFQLNEIDQHFEEIRRRAQELTP